MKTYKTMAEKPRLVIEHDEFCPSPRDFDNLGYFITLERNYNSPDDEEELRSLIGNAGEESANVEEHMEKIKEEMEHNGYGEVVYITPVYRYEHGSVLYRRGAAHGFDYSNCGFYIVTDKTLAVLGTPKDRIISVIDEELEIYTAWANGDVYRYTLYDEDGDEVDACGGFNSLDHIKEELPEEWQDEDMEQYLV